MSLREKTTLSLFQFHLCGAGFVIVRYVVDPRAQRMAPHEPCVAGFQQVGRRTHIFHPRIKPEVGGGKNVAMDRAKVLLKLRYKEEYLPAAPARTRALMNMIGDKPSGQAGSKERS